MKYQELRRELYVFTFNLSQGGFNRWRWLTADVHLSGIDFAYKGDILIWLWPWKRSGRNRGKGKGLAKYVSITASGNGEFGDGRFYSLKEVDKFLFDLEMEIAKQTYSLDPLSMPDAIPFGDSLPKPDPQDPAGKGLE